MKEFTYKTTTEEKRVVMGKHQDRNYFVDIYPEFGVHTSNYYDTEEEALKRFNSIKKRVRVISE
tara:strand:+ start:354 stop:545 length:192 start_codon:yes stop_codon:yes gene_type:complete